MAAHIGPQRPPPPADNYSFVAKPGEMVSTGGLKMQPGPSRPLRLPSLRWVGGEAAAQKSEHYSRPPLPALTALGRRRGCCAKSHLGVQALVAAWPGEDTTVQDPPAAACMPACMPLADSTVSTNPTTCSPQSAPLLLGGRGLQRLCQQWRLFLSSSAISLRHEMCAGPHPAHSRVDWHFLQAGTCLAVTLCKAEESCILLAEGFAREDGLRSPD